MEPCFFCGKLPDAPLFERELENTPVQSIGSGVSRYIWGHPAYRAQVECLHVTGFGTHQVQGSVRAGRTAEEAIELAVQSWDEEQRERRAKRMSYIAAEKVRLQGEIAVIEASAHWMLDVYSALRLRNAALRRLCEEEVRLKDRSHGCPGLDPSS